MTTATKGWPPSRRKRQAETIRRTRPWTRSTGPRTAAGKAACARNGYRRSPRIARQVDEVDAQEVKVG